MAKPTVTTMVEPLPDGGLFVRIFENGREVYAYTTFKPYTIDQARAEYRRAKRVYGARPSLPLQDSIHVN